MKSLTLLLFVYICMWVCAAQADDGTHDLIKLGEQIRYVRSLPFNAPTNYMCPENLEAFKRIKRDKILSVPGTPDFYSGNLKIKPESSRKWSYFLTSPRRPIKLGGGFPEITFYFNSKDYVVRTTCYYSK